MRSKVKGPVAVQERRQQERNWRFASPVGHKQLALGPLPRQKTHAQGKSQKKENAEKSACSAQPPADHNRRGFSSGHFSPERILTSGYFSLHSKLTPLPGKPAGHVFQEAMDNMGPNHRHFSAVAPEPRGRDTSCSSATSTL